MFNMFLLKPLLHSQTYFPGCVSVHLLSALASTSNCELFLLLCAVKTH